MSKQLQQQDRTPTPSPSNDDSIGDMSAPIDLESIVEEVIDESVFLAEDERSDAKMPAATTKHGLLMECQNVLSVIYYKTANTRDIKQDVLITSMCRLLFSNSTRMGCAEQFIKGNGPFMSLFDPIPVEARSMNASNSAKHQLKFKLILLNNEENSWCADMFTTEMLCSTLIKRTQKFSCILNSSGLRKIAKKLHKNSVSYSTGKPNMNLQQTMFISAIKDVEPEIDPKDNLKGH